MTGALIGRTFSLATATLAFRGALLYSARPKPPPVPVLPPKATSTVSPFLARPDLAVIRVTGNDRLSYLDDVTTQRLVDAQPGEVLATLHLDPHGTVLAAMDVLVREADLLLLTPGDVADHVLEVLGGRTFLLDATFELVEKGVVSVRGADQEPLVVVLGVVPPVGSAAEVHGVTVIGREGGADLVGAGHAIEEQVEALLESGVRQGGPTDLDDWRIRSGIPRWGREIVAGHLPEELGLLPTHVHLAKGCYPGQEAVARMWMLGRPRRRLAQVDVTGAVSPGWEVGEGRQRVTVTGVTSDGEAGFAFVPGGTDDGEVFEEGERRITVRRVLGATLDVPGHDPEITRRRDRRGATSEA